MGLLRKACAFALLRNKFRALLTGLLIFFTLLAFLFVVIIQYRHRMNLSSNVTISV